MGKDGAILWDKEQAAKGDAPKVFPQYVPSPSAPEGEGEGEAASPSVSASTNGPDNIPPMASKKRKNKKKSRKANKPSGEELSAVISYDLEQLALGPTSDAEAA